MFIFSGASDSDTTLTTRDTITDFQTGEDFLHFANLRDALVLAGSVVGAFSSVAVTLAATYLILV